MGGLIAARLSSNPVGRLFAILGFVLAVLMLEQQYVDYALVTAPDSLPAGHWAAWASSKARDVISRPYGSRVTVPVTFSARSRGKKGGS